MLPTLDNKYKEMLKKKNYKLHELKGKLRESEHDIYRKESKIKELEEEMKETLEEFKSRLIEKDVKIYEIERELKESEDNIYRKGFEMCTPVARYQEPIYPGCGLIDDELLYDIRDAEDYYRKTTKIFATASFLLSMSLIGVLYWKIKY